MFEAGIEATAWARTSTLRLRLRLQIASDDDDDDDELMMMAYPWLTAVKDAASVAAERLWA